MARDGYRVFDSDTHVYEPAELLEQHLSARWRKALETCNPPVQRVTLRGGLHGHRVAPRKSGHRHLGTQDMVEQPQGKGAVDVPWKAQWKGPPFPTERVNDDPHARVADMDIEGTDVHLIIPTAGASSFAAADDPGLELAMYEAYHRYMSDYCGPYPNRLKGVVLASTRDVEGSVAEIDRCAKEEWPVALFPIALPDKPLDVPDLEPLWAKAVEYDLAVVVHVFNMTTPLPPGMGDFWDNVFLQRAASGSWAGMRGMAALIGSGLLDRFPELRIGVLETGHGWLPSWAFHLDEIAEMASYAIAPLKQKPSEYVRGPQYFHSIEMHEGEGVLKSAIGLIGPDTLMFATDYPHTECWFPKSVETVLGWTSLSEEEKRKLLWDNAVHLYGRCSGL